MNRRTLIILLALAILIIAAVVGYAVTRPLAETATVGGAVVSLVALGVVAVLASKKKRRR